MLCIDHRDTFTPSIMMMFVLYPTFSRTLIVHSFGSIIMSDVDISSVPIFSKSESYRNHFPGFAIVIRNTYPSEKGHSSSFDLRPRPMSENIRRPLKGLLVLIVSIAIFAVEGLSAFAVSGALVTRLGFFLIK